MYNVLSFYLENPIFCKDVSLLHLYKRWDFQEHTQ